MTTVEVSSYDDLRGDAVSSAREKDRIIQALADTESDAKSVFRADEWLWSDKALEPVAGLETIVVARTVAETEDAWLLTQAEDLEDPDASDPRTDWVPKSVTRQYVASKEGIETDEQPQAFLGDWES